MKRAKRIAAGHIHRNNRGFAMKEKEGWREATPLKLYYS
jgi:hypothetical protein